MCRISPNFELLGEGPILGQGAPSKLLISHNESMLGAFCGVNLFPETESFIVMLSNWHPRIAGELKSARQPGTTPKELSQYVGVYTNLEGYLTIAVKVADDKLIMSFQNCKDEEFGLRHYEYDTFCWLQPRYELVKRARNVVQPAENYLMRLSVYEHGSIEQLNWINDSAVPTGQVFIRGT